MKRNALWWAGYLLGKLLLLSLHGIGIAVGLVAIAAAGAGAVLGVVVHPAFWVLPVTVAVMLWALLIRAVRRDARRVRRAVHEAWDTPTMPLSLPDWPTREFARKAAGAGSPTTPRNLAGKPATIRRRDGLAPGMAAYPGSPPPAGVWPQGQAQHGDRGPWLIAGLRGDHYDRRYEGIYEFGDDDL